MDTTSDEDDLDDDCDLSDSGEETLSLSLSLSCSSFSNVLQIFILLAKSTVPPPERRVCSLLSKEKMASLTEEEILNRISIYSYPTVVEKQQKFSSKTLNWRLIVRFLVDKEPFIEFTDLVKGEFEITNKKAYSTAVEEISGGMRKPKIEYINQNLDLKKANLEYLQKGVLQFVKWQELLSQRVSHNY